MGKGQQQNNWKGKLERQAEKDEHNVTETKGIKFKEGRGGQSNGLANAEYKSQITIAGVSIKFSKTFTFISTILGKWQVKD